MYTLPIKKERKILKTNIYSLQRDLNQSLQALCGVEEKPLSYANVAENWPKHVHFDSKGHLSGTNKYIISSCECCLQWSCCFCLFHVIFRVFTHLYSHCCKNGATCGSDHLRMWSEWLEPRKRPECFQNRTSGRSKHVGARSEQVLLRSRRESAASLQLPEALSFHPSVGLRCRQKQRWTMRCNTILLYKIKIPKCQDLSAANTPDVTWSQSLHNSEWEGEPAHPIVSPGF